MNSRWQLPLPLGKDETENLGQKNPIKPPFY
jgi:hypothetical protein